MYDKSSTERVNEAQNSFKKESLECLQRARRLKVFCFVCRELVSSQEKVETFSSSEKTLTIHKDCLPVFQSLIIRVLGEQYKLETKLDRPLSIVEFLKEKQPKTEPEILACLAYFLEQKAGKPLELSVKDIKQHLEATDFRIDDLSTAFIRARTRKGFFERVSASRPITHRLTRTGVEFVEKLPERA